MITERILKFIKYSCIGLLSAATIAFAAVVFAANGSGETISAGDGVKAHATDLYAGAQQADYNAMTSGGTCAVCGQTTKVIAAPLQLAAFFKFAGADMNALSGCFRVENKNNAFGTNFYIDTSAWTDNSVQAAFGVDGFKGHMDFNGLTLKMSYFTGDYTTGGLFPNADGATLENIHIENYKFVQTVASKASNLTLNNWDVDQYITQRSNRDDDYAGNDMKLAALSPYAWKLLGGTVRDCDMMTFITYDGDVYLDAWAGMIWDAQNGVSFSNCTVNFGASDHALYYTKIAGMAYYFRDAAGVGATVENCSVEFPDDGKKTLCPVSENSYYSGTKETGVFGGLFGEVSLSGNAKTLTVSGCRTNVNFPGRAASFSGINKGSGGLIGQMSGNMKFAISDCEVTGNDLCANVWGLGGLIGNIELTTSNTVTNCSVKLLGTLWGGARTSGFIAVTKGTTSVKDCESYVETVAFGGVSSGPFIGACVTTLTVNGCSAYTGKLSGTNANYNYMGGLISQRMGDASFTDCKSYVGETEVTDSDTFDPPVSFTGDYLGRSQNGSMTVTNCVVTELFGRDEGTSKVSVLKVNNGAKVSKQQAQEIIEKKRTSFISSPEVQWTVKQTVTPYNEFDVALTFAAEYADYTIESFSFSLDNGLYYTQLIYGGKVIGNLGSTDGKANPAIGSAVLCGQGFGFHYDVQPVTNLNRTRIKMTLVKDAETIHFVVGLAGSISKY